MRSLYKYAVAALLFAVLSGCAFLAAPPGYHYETGSFTQVVPNDPCWRKEWTSPGSISWINASVGHPNGVLSSVDSISDLASPDYNKLSVVGIKLRQGMYSGGSGTSGINSISCHATLSFTNGTKDSGILSIFDPGAYATIQVEWVSDEAIAEHLAQKDRLRTSKNLLVNPDLSNPEIQRCVGQQTAFGAGEDFAGQLWIACADKLGLLHSGAKK